MSSFGPDTKSSRQDNPIIGVIGGSGICDFPELHVLARKKPKTKYGPPSDDVLIGEIDGIRVAFLPRHGSKHDIYPHRVPYKANLEALKMVGAEFVIATCIVGSLKQGIPPGSMVVPDQFVDLTWGREDTSAADSKFIHLPMAEPYCEHVRTRIIRSLSRLGLDPVDKATVAVIQGPRFATIAESRWMSSNGWDIVNMTQYPECYFARELGLCYGAMAAVTDYDVGLLQFPAINPDHMDSVLAVFRENIAKTRRFLVDFIGGEAATLSCGCARKMMGALYEESL